LLLVVFSYQRSQFHAPLDVKKCRKRHYVEKCRKALLGLYKKSQDRPGT
jgi:hypothetical protein